MNKSKKRHLENEAEKERRLQLRLKRQREANRAARQDRLNRIYYRLRDEEEDASA